MRLIADNFFTRDIEVWLMNTCPIDPEHIDTDKFAADLIAHTDPNLGLRESAPGTVTWRDAEDGQLHTKELDDDEDAPRVVTLDEVLCHVPDQRAVRRAVRAYLRRGAVGADLPTYADALDYRPAGLTVPVEVRGFMRQTMTFAEWQTISDGMTASVADQFKRDHMDASVAEFNMQAWCVEVFNQYGRVVIGDSRLWTRLDGAVDLYGLLENFTLTNEARRELRRRNDRLGSRSETAAGMDWFDNSELGGLSGSNYPGGFVPQR